MPKLGRKEILEIGRKEIPEIRRKAIPKIGETSRTLFSTHRGNAADSLLDKTETVKQLQGIPLIRGAFKAF